MPAPHRSGLSNCPRETFNMLHDWTCGFYGDPLVGRGDPLCGLAICRLCSRPSLGLTSVVSFMRHNAEDVAVLVTGISAIIELGYIAFSFSRTASRLKRQPDEAKRNVLNRTSCIILSAFRITCFWLIIDIASFRGESHMESRWNRWFLRSVQHGT